MTLDYATILITIGTLLSAGAAVIGVFNRRHIQQLHIDVNSRLSELVAASHAAGVGEGVASERAAALLPPTADATT